MATTNKAFRVKSGLIVEGAELKPAKGTTTYPPILFTSSAGDLITATAGAMEYDGTNFYLTPASTRKTIAFTDSVLTSSVFLGTTAVPLNRSSGSLSLAGVSIDGAAGSVTNSVTFNTTGGAAAGTSYNGGTARTIDYSTVGAAAASHTHGNILSGGTITTSVTATSPVKVVITDSSNAVGTLTTTGASGTTFLRGDGTWVTPTDTNWYPTTFTYTGGTNAGPTGSLTGSGMSAVSFAAIPSAASNASGIVTNAAQEFGGVKTFTSPSITTSLTTTSTTFALANTTATTVNFAGAATALSIGAATGTTTVNNSLVVSGNLTVNGTTTTLNSNTLAVDDKNLELGSVTSGVISATGTVGTVSGSGPFTATITGMASTAGLIPGQVITATAGTGNFGSGVMSVATVASSTSITISSTLTFTAGSVTNISGNAASDASADGGGITLKGTTDKTFRWVDNGDNWTSSENLSLDTGKTLKINNSNVVSGTAAALVIGEGASTTIAIGAAGGTATILNPTVTLTNATALNMNGSSPTIATVSTGTASVFNTTATTVNLGGQATTLNLATGSFSTLRTINIGSASSGTGNAQTINLGVNSTTTATSTINIGGSTSTTTTVTGTVKLPTVGTSGFVKLGTGGELSADTNTYVAAASPALTGTPTINSIAGLVTASGSTTGTTALTLSTVYASGTYNGGEFIVKATNSTNIEITKVLVITDGTNVYMTVYGDVFVSTDLVNIDFTYTGANVNMVITPVAGTSGTTTVKVTGTLVAV